MQKSSVLRLEACLNFIEQNHKDVVFTKVYGETARAEALAADARKKLGIKLSAIDGRIVSIKDLFDVKGEITTAGTKILADNKPALKDAEIVTRLRQAGAVIIGKTNMSEFAFHGIGTNPHFGNCGNAYDKAHVPGGSSSGAAVSATEGSSEIAIGSDTGGSIRTPASLNGCVGFKPSQYRVSREGAFPLSYSLDSVGPLAKTVQDCIDMDGVLSGDNWQGLTPFPLKQIVAAIPCSRLIDNAEPETQAAFKAALQKLEKQGVKLVEVEFEDFMQRYAAMMELAPLVSIEAAEIHRDFYEARAKDYDPPVYARISIGAKTMATTYVHIMQLRARFIKEYECLMQDFDVMVLPTTLIRAPKIAVVAQSLEAFMAQNARVLHNNTLGNLLDCCGISLPLPVDGLPIGFQLMAPNGQDKKLLRMALSFESCLK